MEVVATGLRFPEGPVAMPDGSVIVVLYHGRRMLRLAPDFLEQTSLREDFAEGIARWCHVGTEGVEIIAGPDDGGKVMCIRSPFC